MDNQQRTLLKQSETLDESHFRVMSSGSVATLRRALLDGLANCLTLAVSTGKTIDAARDTTVRWSSVYTKRLTGRGFRPVHAMAKGND